MLRVIPVYNKTTGVLTKYAQLTKDSRIKKRSLVLLEVIRPKEVILGESKKDEEVSLIEQHAVFSKKRAEIMLGSRFNVKK